jgi:hypothetical protein
MTPPLSRSLQLPDHWTPTEALAAFELIDLLRDHLWDVYSSDIQTALRDDPQDADPRQLHLDLDGDPPF